MAVRPKLDKSGKPLPGEYIIDVRLQGRNGPRDRIPFTGTEAQARAAEMELRGRGKPGVGACVSPTFLDAIPEFLRDYGNHVTKGTITDFHWAWKQLETTFGKIPMANLGPALVEQYKAKRLQDGVKKRTINRELTYLSAIIKWAEENRHIPPAAYRIKRFPKKQTKSPAPTVHTPQELQAIIDEIPAHKRGLVLLLYDAGLRRAEALTIRGDQVDLARGVIHIIGKGGKERQVPILTQRLRDELAARIELHGKGYLWINPITSQPYKDIRSMLREAAARADVDKRIYHHLLRHDHGTHAAIAEVDPRAVQQMLGHSNLSTTEIYTHIAGEFVATQGAKLAKLIEKGLTVDRKTTKKTNDTE